MAIRATTRPAARATSAATEIFTSWRPFRALTVAALEQACQEAGLPYRLGKAWTTDGFFRETVARRDRRRTEGCIVVEM